MRGQSLSQTPLDITSITFAKVYSHSSCLYILRPHSAWDIVDVPAILMV